MFLFLWYRNWLARSTLGSLRSKRRTSWTGSSRSRSLRTIALFPAKVSPFCFGSLITLFHARVGQFWFGSLKTIGSLIMTLKEVVGKNRLEFEIYSMHASTQPHIVINTKDQLNCETKTNNGKSLEQGFQYYWGSTYTKISSPNKIAPAQKNHFYLTLIEHHSQYTFKVPTIMLLLFSWLNNWKSSKLL